MGKLHVLPSAPGINLPLPCELMGSLRSLSSSLRNLSLSHGVSAVLAAK